MSSGYDCLKSHVLRCWRNDVNDWADVVSSGRAFQMRGAAIGKALLPTVESLTESTTRRLVPAERSVRRPCRSATATMQCIVRYRHIAVRSVMSLVTALVLSRLDYGNGTLVGLPSNLIRHLQSVQNAAARLIFRLRRSDHITDAYIGCECRKGLCSRLQCRLTGHCTVRKEGATWHHLGCQFLVQ